MNTRCAVVVAVSKTGDLAALESPIPGAKAIADLLRVNAYDVTLVTDEAGPVTAAQIAAAIRLFIDQQPIRGYRLLILYFSGHGYWKNEGDLWLLSHAPADAGEAISLYECADLAQDSGIENVVLISDACRSTPKGKVAARVRGSIVFPNLNGAPGRRSKIDRLIASREGTAAYEAPIGNNGLESVFTHCLLKAFNVPDPDMVLTVSEADQTFSVVPNRRLEKFLLREVEDVLAKVSVKLSQEPVIDVVSDDAVYIARVAGNAPASPQPPPADSLTVEVDLTPAAIAVASTFDINIDVAGNLEIPTSPPTAGTALSSTRTIIRHAFDASLQSIVKPMTTEQLEQLHQSRPRRKNKRVRSANTVFLSDLAENFASGGLGPVARLVSRFESGTGFTLTGAAVDAAFLEGPNSGNNSIDVIERGGKDAIGILRVWLDGRTSTTMLLVLDNGRGIPLAVLAGYIGHISVRDGQVQTISYIPVDPNHGKSERPWRWDAYVRNRETLERLRAIAAAAVAGNHFRFGNAERATQMATVLRDVKAVDPMLGLFAAYAYLEADSDDQIRSVQQYMLNDLNAQLFDVAMLAKQRSSPTLSHHIPVVPYCPILTQGWNYIRSRSIDLPPVLAEAQDALLPGPFTTFSRPQTTKIAYAMSRGQIVRN